MRSQLLAAGLPVEQVDHVEPKPVVVKSAKPGRPRPESRPVSPKTRKDQTPKAEKPSVPEVAIAGNLAAYIEEAKTRHGFDAGHVALLFKAKTKGEAKEIVKDILASRQALTRI